MRSLGSADSNAVYVQQVTVTGNPGADPLNVTQDQPPTIHSVDITNVAALANLLGNSGGESLTSADNLAESWTASEISGGQLDTLDTNQILIAEVTFRVLKARTLLCLRWKILRRIRFWHPGSSPMMALVLSPAP